MAKNQKPEDLQRLLTPVEGGRELDELISELLDQSNQGVLVEHLVVDRAAPEMPMFLQAAETRAAEHGVSVEQLLADYSARLKSSTYPTLDCLLPEEVQRVIEGGELSVEQREHLSGCEPCRNLLEAASLSAKRREQLMANLRANQTARGLSSWMTKGSTQSWKTQTPGVVNSKD